MVTDHIYFGLTTAQKALMLSSARPGATFHCTCWSCKCSYSGQIDSYGNLWGASFAKPDPTFLKSKTKPVLTLASPLWCCSWGGSCATHTPTARVHPLFQAAAESPVQCIVGSESLDLECPAFLPCAPCFHSSLIKLKPRLNLPSTCFKGQWQRTNCIWLVFWLTSSINQPPCFIQEKEILISMSED